MIEIVRVPSGSASSAAWKMAVLSTPAGTTAKMHVRSCTKCRWTNASTRLIMAPSSLSPTNRTSPGKSVKVRSGKSGPCNWISIRSSLIVCPSSTRCWVRCSMAAVTSSTAWIGVGGDDRRLEAQQTHSSRDRRGLCKNEPCRASCCEGARRRKRDPGQRRQHGRHATGRGVVHDSNLRQFNVLVQPHGPQPLDQVASFALGQLGNQHGGA
ncbi:hypothetical protein H310_02111 [Aphanomyces invadans]|uniref:Uncharacterized protein n=1 Tax=Aphanomyces invadans TaxID=157072 RepID=A0A024UMV5_9STRA|nr:hypothetical protein H310_02111 [Aphanomyces invadans]ETW07644.1 hypothetical protein H310_02111 [Aphanomyces invadans]|eukprot:XP_008863737.1 hypothetical protein H310_02111 [Aphanomyces invadans]